MCRHSGETGVDAVEEGVGACRSWLVMPEHLAGDAGALCQVGNQARVPAAIRPFGSIFGMAKEKATITVDRAKLAEARALLGVPSASAAIDIALCELVQRLRRRHDVRAYMASPPTTEEQLLGHVAAADWRALADDTDWDLEWDSERSTDWPPGA